MRTTQPHTHLFREVTFDVRGRLFLHSMPGRREPVSDTVTELKSLGVNRVVSLAPETKVIQYVAEIAEGASWLHVAYPIPDRDVPSNMAGFIELARDTASTLKNGEHVLVHCGAGIGRTGVFAIAVGMACGLPLREATRRVASRHSGPENEKQRMFVRAVSRAFLRLGGRG